MSLTLYTYPNSVNSNKALIAAQYCNVKINVPAFKFGEENKTPEFLKKNPNGKVPTLETPEGCLFESNAIARYVARMRPDVGLCGNSFYECGQVDQWCDWNNTELAPAVSAWIYPLLGYGQYRQNEETQAKAKTATLLKIMDDYLLHHTFIAGERISLADIVLCCTLMMGFKNLFDASYRKGIPNVTRWFITLINQPEFSAVLGKVELCEKMMTYEKPKKEKEGKKENKSEKAEAPAEEAPKPKAKNPFEELPPTKMVLDDWLRTYSNYHEADFHKVMDLFYPVYDAEGWSLWLSDYMYDTDNEVLFMTANFVDGYIQRCDALRKYAFGTMIIYGDEEHKPYKVKGAWLIRGHSIEPMLENNPDAEYFTWTEVKLDNEEQKKQLADRWCSKETFDNLPVQLFAQFK